VLVTDEVARHKKWEELQAHVKVAEKARDYGALKSLYFAQALHRYKYGGEFLSLSKKARRCELLDYKSSGMVTRVEIIATDDSCPACRALHGRTLSIGTALKQMPIPATDCTHDADKHGDRGWCRCCYVASFD